MKLNKIILAIPVTLTLLFAGCSTGTNGSDAPVTAPDMGDAATLAKSGATASPADETAALSLFKKSMQTVMNQAESYGYKSNSSAAARTAMSYSYKGHIDWTGTGYSVTGPYNISADCPDYETYAYALYGAKANLSAINNTTVDVNLVGTFTDAKISPSGSSSYYTISGKFIDQSYTQINMTAKSGSDIAAGTNHYTTTVTGTYKYDMRYGAALSVKDSTGTGAKYILSLYYTASGNLSETGSTGVTNVGTLNVYDDTNALLYTIKLSPNDLVIE